MHWSYIFEFEIEILLIQLMCSVSCIHNHNIYDVDNDGKLWEAYNENKLQSQTDDPIFLENLVQNLSQ